MLAKYNENPKQNWRSKDAALYLVTSLVSRGSTQKHGVTQTTQLVSIPQFFQDQILPELKRTNGKKILFFFCFYLLFFPVDELPVLKADAIKYLLTFRSVLPSEMVVGSVPLLIQHLPSESAVIHTYAACTIEKVLIMRDSNNQSVLSGAALEPLTNQLLVNLFAILDKPVSEENEYVMKSKKNFFL